MWKNNFFLIYLTSPVNLWVMWGVYGSVALCLATLQWLSLLVTCLINRTLNYSVPSTTGLTRCYGVGTQIQALRAVLNGGLWVHQDPSVFLTCFPLSPQLRLLRFLRYACSLSTVSVGESLFVGKASRDENKSSQSVSRRRFPGW